MTIIFRKQDLFAEAADALVNPVDCEGTLKGLGEEFRKRFPDNYKAFKRAAEKGELKVGRAFITQNIGEPMIINLPVKKRAKDPLMLDDVEKGLTDLARVLAENNIRSIAMPVIFDEVLKADAGKGLAEKKLGVLQNIRIIIIE